MQHLIDKAAVLQETLPYIRRFHGEIFVIKYGGHAMIDPALRASFARDVVLMKYVGLNPVIVHGGGPQIDAKLKEFGVESTKLQGLRVTDDRTMEVVEMVLGGSVNQEIVSLIAGHGGRAVGLTGRDAGFVRAKRVKSMVTKTGDTVDPGRVGAVERVEPKLIRTLVDAGYIPVVSPVAVDSEARSLNVNADAVAGALAAALEAKKLVLLTDIEGVRGADGTVQSSISAAQVEQLRGEGVIQGGMVPKVECALAALESGVGKAHIIDGRMRHAVLLELFTDGGIGTELTR